MGAKIGSRAKEPTSSLGAYLRHQRLQAGLSLTDIVRRSRDVSTAPEDYISQAYLSHLESSPRRPNVSIRKLSVLAHLFGVSLNEIIDATESPRRERLQAQLARLTQAGFSLNLSLRGDPLVRDRRRLFSVLKRVHQLQSGLKAIQRDLHVLLAIQQSEKSTEAPDD